MRKLIIILPMELLACARASTIPLAQDTVQITAHAAPACGAAGAQKIAVRQAAVETLRRGYDRFIVMGAEGQSNLKGIIYTDSVVTPMFSHEQGLIVKMFKASDPQGVNAVDAKAELGPQWQEAVNSQSRIAWIRLLVSSHGRAPLD